MPGVLFQTMASQYIGRVVIPSSSRHEVVKINLNEAQLQTLLQRVGVTAH